MTARRSLRVAGVAWLFWCAIVSPAAGQAPSGSPRASWEVGGGVVFVSGYDLGTQPADLTRNTGTTAAPFELFTTDSRVSAGPALQGRVGYYLTRDLLLEGGIRFAKPVLEIRVTADAEDAPDETTEDTLSQYVVDVSAVWHLSALSIAGGRGVPFVTAGVGYLRELHEGDELVETGTALQVGGGFKYWFGAGRRVGLRGDAALSFRDGGFDFEEGVRMLPTLGASMVLVF